MKMLKAFLGKERLPMRRTKYLRLSKIEGLYKTIIAGGGRRKIREKGNVDKMYKGFTDELTGLNCWQGTKM